MNALDWLGYLIEWIGKLFPRVQIVRRTQGGVRFVGGSKVKEVKPGVRVYWPIMTDMVITPTIPQSENLVSQTAVTKDGRQLHCSIMVIYKVKDPVRALTRIDGINETVMNTCLSATLEVVSQHALDELQPGIATEIEIKLTKLCRRRLRQFGITITRAAFTDFSPCKTLNLVGQGHA